MSGGQTLITWTLSGAYLVRGQVDDFEYLPMPGATITVTNLRTNEDSTATVEEDGAYSIDLGDTSAGAFPSGYAIGDEVEIKITHRDTTRKWKRRVAGSELVQDVHMTHGTWEAALRQAKLVLQESYTGTAGTQITFNDKFTTGVLSVKKNGTLLAESAWSFAPSNALNITTSFSTSDVFEVHRIVHRSEQEAKDEVVGSGDAAIANALARYYTSPIGTRVPELQDISEALAAATLRDMTYSAPGKTDSLAKGLRELAMDALSVLREGKKSLTDQDGAFLTPTAQASTTPQSSVTPTRSFTRFTDENTKLVL